MILVIYYTMPLSVSAFGTAKLTTQLFLLRDAARVPTCLLILTSVHVAKFHFGFYV